MRIEECNEMTASELYEKGNELRQKGLWHEAMNAYQQASELNPCSPAVVARQMLADIMNFYHKDAYNP